MHIDFGFLISNSPGGNRNFEKAPFKLTEEMVEILGGPHSQYFDEYLEQMKLGFMAIQENARKIIVIIEMMFMG